MPRPHTHQQRLRCPRELTRSGSPARQRRVCSRLNRPRGWPTRLLDRGAHKARAFRAFACSLSNRPRNTASPTPQVASPLTGATSGCWHALGRRPWRAPGRVHAAGPSASAAMPLCTPTSRPSGPVLSSPRTAMGCRGSSRTISERFSAAGGWAGGLARPLGSCTGARGSMQGCGFCPSCGGRRMAERAAHPSTTLPTPCTRMQPVPGLPHRVRYLVAWRHDLCRAVLRVLMRAVDRHLRTWPAHAGLRDARGGGALPSFNGSVGSCHLTSMCMPSRSTECSPARVTGVCGFILRPNRRHSTSRTS